MRATVTIPSSFRKTPKPGIRAIVPVKRPLHAAVAIAAVERRVYHGVLHDPKGLYTVGPTVLPGKPWGGHFALYGHTCRADYSKERVWTTDEDDRPLKAATAFVEAVGADAAMAACRHFDETH